MKSNMLPLIFVASGLLSTTAFAKPAGFYIEAEGAYVKAADTLISNATFATTDQPISATQDLTVNYFVGVKPNWQYRLGVGYDFPSCSNVNYGLALDYSWFSDKISKETPFFTADGVQTPVIFDQYAHATVEYKNKFQTSSLRVYRSERLNNALTLNWFTGLKYADISEQGSATFSIDPIPTPSSIGFKETSTKSNFKGLGPMFGLNAQYSATQNLGVKAEIAGSLLGGNNDNSFIDLGDGLPHFAAFNNGALNVVPTVNGRVSLAYTARFSNCSTLEIDAGYKAERYFNAMPYSAVESQVGFVFDESATYHDFMVAGPFIEVTFHV